MMSGASRPKAKRYAVGKIRLWVIGQLLTIGLLVAVQLSGTSRRWAEQAWYLADGNPWLEVAIFTWGLGALFTLLELPLAWYGGFYMEHGFGLSTQTLRSWLIDQAKQLTLGGLFGLVIVETLYAILRTVPPLACWFWIGGAWIGYSVVLAWIFPVWILPLFFKVTPLGDAGLAQRLRALAERCGVAMVGIFTINLGSKTKKANAMLAGIGRSRRVLLGDTLLGYPPEEVEVVLAHEIGHHRLRHIWKLLVIGGALGLAGFGLIGVAMERLVRPLGLGGIDDVAGLPLIWLLFSLYHLVLMPLQHGISRHFERGADRFALETTRQPEAFIGCMRRLAEQNLSDVDPSPWVEWWLYDHPSIARRIRMAEAFARRSAGPRGDSAVGQAT